MTAPRIVRLPDGTLWLVADGVGHQITGTGQSMWARIMYGQPEEADEPDWDVGPTVLEIYGGPGGIEQVAQGLRPDPLGWWRVRNSTPTNVLSDHTHVVDPDGFHYLVAPDGRAWKATGEGQIRSLDAEWGEATPIGHTPENVVGAVTGAGTADLFRPNEIEVLSGLANQLLVDGTTGDDQISVRLPGLDPLPPPDPEGAETNSPDLADQVMGAQSDRTPGLAQNPITPAPAPAPPDEPVDTTEPPAAEPEPAPAPAPTPPAAENPGGPINRPGRYPTNPGPINRPGRPSTPPAAENPGGPINRPGRYPTNPGPVNRPGRTSALQPRRLPPSRYDRVRAFLDRTGGDTTWLDRVEHRRSS
jgi:hypothetical protein